MGWERAYGASTDVHQALWYIRVPESDLTDRRYLPERGPSIMPEAFRLPRLGEWSIKANLDGRPAGNPVGFSALSGVYNIHYSQVRSIEGYPLFFEQ
jgi:hypothetical protein